MNAESELVIVGGGLVGSLLGSLLSDTHQVSIWEKRPDPSRAAAEVGRSINLVLTARGQHALEQAGILQEALDISVPVYGRMIHSLGGDQMYQPYGVSELERNYSIPRGGLNDLLLDTARKRGVKLFFDRQLEAIDPDARTATWRDTKSGATSTIAATHLVGADGWVSAVRQALNGRAGFDFTTKDLGHSYKELTIPSQAGGYALDPKALHIWPRGHMMLMALPNKDGSFTVTLYLPNEGVDSFRELNTEEAVLSLFHRMFPDAVATIPNLVQECLENPTGHLGTVHCDPWHFGGFTTLIGDAAHAIVPFFGQGMNSGFEDCLELTKQLGFHSGNWNTALPEFYKVRKPNSDAIAEMSLDNFIEMSARVGDPEYILRKKIEQKIEVEWPELYRSRYRMVAYSLVPYTEALSQGAIQNEILAELSQGITDVNDLDLQQAYKLVSQRLPR